MTYALLTRPQQHNDTLKPLIEAVGISVISAPLLQIEYCGTPSLALSASIQGYLFTSVHGVHALARHNPMRLPALCIGPSSGEAARSYGFEVFVGDGRATTLLALADKHFPAEAGALYHSCGHVVAEGIIAQLRARGWTIEQEVLYRANAATHLPSDVARLLHSGAISYALFFSKRTADIFTSLVESTTSLETTQALALNEATALVLGTLPFQAIHTADAPTQQAMVSLMRRLTTKT